MGITFILLIFGLIMLASAGVVLSETRFGDAYYLFKRQLLFGVIPGLALFFIFQKVNYRFWKKVSVLLFFVTIILLFLVLMPGIGSSYKGASSWIDLGPISFQPTEMAKFTMIIYLAAWLESRGRKIKSFKEGLLPFLAILCAVSALIISQPDLGTLGAIVIISVMMLFASGAPIKHLAGLFAGGVSIILLLIKLEPYRMDRLKVFLGTGIDPQGIGYQINQALMAVGSGGLFGLGLGYSRQKFNYLPEPVGDSIFAIIAEELGFIGAGLLLLLFIAFALRGFRIARFAPDQFSRMVAIGISSWIIFQALINIMAIIKLIPLTGITLPLISYGSSSLVFTLLGIAVLLNISKHTDLSVKK